MAIVLWDRSANTANGIIWKTQKVFLYQDSWGTDFFVIKNSKDKEKVHNITGFTNFCGTMEEIVSPFNLSKIPFPVQDGQNHATSCKHSFTEMSVLDI